MLWQYTRNSHAQGSFVCNCLVCCGNTHETHMHKAGHGRTVALGLCTGRNGRGAQDLARSTLQARRFAHVRPFHGPGLLKGRDAQRAGAGGGRFPNLCGLKSLRKTGAGPGSIQSTPDLPKPRVQWCCGKFWFSGRDVREFCWDSKLNVVA